MSNTPIKRRKIVFGLAGGLLLSPFMDRNQAFAMGGMSMDGMHGEEADGSGYKGAKTLMPVSAMPSGLPLPKLPVLANRSRKAGVFKAKLVAAPSRMLLVPGFQTEALCYNSTMPGPLIEAYEGDLVEVEFFNRLHERSTVHWHGLAVPSDQDGAPEDFIEAGGKRLYHFTLPKGSAGTHWYHPHPHMITASQVYRGLAGGIIVRAKDDPLQAIPEQNLLISDLRLATDGGIPPNDREDWMNGREGQFVLVNGANQPRISLTGTQRWRIWNASNARYLRLSLGGHPFSLVATDGGLLGAPIENQTEILLTPAQRAEIVVHAPENGQALELVAEPYDRGAMGRLKGLSPRRVLADIDVTPGGKHFEVPAVLRPIEPLENPTGHHTSVFSDFVDTENNPENIYEHPTDMLFLVNGQVYDIERIDVEAKLGAVEEWTLVNASSMGMQHPFHIHGGQFQVIERSLFGEVTPEPYLAWRDTLNLLPGESATIRMRIDEPGKRMFHCHILEHEDLGMMANLMVSP